MTRAPLSPRALGFGLLYVAGLVLTSRTGAPGVDDPLSSLPGFYDDRGNRIALLVGALAVVAAAPLFLWLLTGLVSALRRVDGNGDGGLALVGGTVFAATAAVAAVSLGLVAGEVSLRGVSQPGPELERWLSEMGYALLLLPAMAGAGVAVLSLSSALQQVRGVGDWLAWAGFVVAVVSFAALPIAIATDLIWSQLPLVVWVVTAAVIVDAHAFAQVLDRDVARASGPVSS
jgi:hypothetical protein